MPGMNPIAGVCTIAAALAGLIFLVKAVQGRCDLDPEISRKSVHVGMGLACLSFPWVFHSPIPVFILALVAGIALAMLRTIGGLKRRLGSVLGGVERQSWGEILFPFSVAFIFFLSHGDPVLYCIPILIMALADALAAIIGKRYGAARYETDDGMKSVEGSMAFLVVTFLSTHVPLLLATNTGRAESLLIATVLGLIVMLMEAISWRGLDNLFVPVVSYVCLLRMLHLTVKDLTLRLLVVMIFVAGWLMWRRKTRLTSSAAIAAGLILYVAWAVGDWNWLIAPLATAAGYSLLCQLPAKRPRQHSVHVIAAIGGVGLFWLAVSQIFGTVNSIYAYGVGYAANLAMIMLARFADGDLQNSMPMAIAKAAALAFALVAGPYLAVWHAKDHVIELSLGAGLLTFGAASLFALLQPGVRDCPLDSARLVRQALISFGFSAVAFFLISKLEPWSTSFR